MTQHRVLDVWLDGFPEPAGQLETLSSGSVAFRYAPAFLGTDLTLSLSLPRSEAPVADPLARAFFDNLLPENDQIQRMIEREGIDRGDLVSILGLVGADCAGAISCLPAGSPPIKVPGELASDYTPLADDELGPIVQRLADREPLPAAVIDPSPVAGIQRKLAVTILPDGRFALPASDRKVPTTHILKVPRRAEGGEAVQEAAACSLASGCGFAASNTQHVVIDGVNAVLIERFDRLVIDDVVYRLHQEDFAQALGLPASLKYERSGAEGRRFDTAGIHGILMQLAQPAQAIETFLLATIFNLAIGNTDNHAKNHGILYTPDGAARLAPLYDMLPIRLSERYTHQLAFHLGGAEFFDTMTTADLEAFLGDFGLAGARARRFIAGPLREMLVQVELRSAGLRAAGLRFFDDLIGRELGRLDDLLELGLDLRERDYFGVGQGAAGGWAGVS
jgi:serine/threonine-protein kinase HipA